MKEITSLNTGYKPKTQPTKDLKLPIKLTNHEGKEIAEIYYDKFKQGYCAFVNLKAFGPYSEFTECVEDCFAHLYQSMHEYRKIAEKHQRLTDALKESLSTPWNKL